MKSKHANHYTIDPTQRDIVLSFDEVKIKENLVSDKYSRLLVGYVDLGDPETNYASFKDHDRLATHVLVFYIRGLASDLSFVYLNMYICMCVLYI